MQTFKQILADVPTWNALAATARNHAAGNVVDLVVGERPRQLAGEDPRSRRLKAVGVVLGNSAVVDHE